MTIIANHSTSRNQPYAPFAAEHEDHWDRWQKAMAWFAGRVEQAVEDADAHPGVSS